MHMTNVYAKRTYQINIPNVHANYNMQTFTSNKTEINIIDCLSDQ
jgi:hypothetical protein